MKQLFIVLLIIAFAIRSFASKDPTISFEKAYTLIKQHQFSLAKSYVDTYKHQVLQLAPLQQSEYYLLNGIIHFELYRFSEALLALEHAKRLAEAHTLSHTLRGRIFLYIGKTHKEGFNNSLLAREFYSLALSHFTEAKDNEHIAAANFQLARSYSFTEVDKREYHNLQALIFYEQDGKQHSQELAECYNLEAIRLSYIMGIGEQAISMYKKAIQTARTYPAKAFTLGKYYDNLGYQYAQINPRKGLWYLQKGLAINLAIPDNDYWIASSYNNIAAVYTEMNSHDSARIYLRKVVPLMIRLYSNDHAEVSNTYYHIGYSYASLDVDSALYYYRKALFISSKSDSIDYALTRKNNDTFVNDLDMYAYIIMYQSELLWRKYQETQNKQYLLTAIYNFTVLHGSIITKLLTIDWESSRNNYLVELRPFYNQFLKLLYEAHQLNDDQQNAIRALNVMEAIRYVSVLEKKREATLYKTSNASPIHSNQLLSARANYVYYRTLMNEVRNIDKKNEALSIQKEFLKASQQYFNLLDSHDTLSYKISYSETSSFLHKLQADEAFLEYYDSDNSFYALLIGQGSIQFHRVEESENVSTLLAQIEKHFSHAPLPHAVTDSLQRFTQLSHSLYQSLIKPFETALFKKKHLTIIPDGALHRLPFETLIRTNEKANSFKDLDYLLYDIVISRALSITQVLAHEHTDQSQQKIAAFASALLPAAENEINSVGQYFNMATFIKDDCSVASFNQSLPQHDLFHLAVHGESDLINPLRSRLVFNETDGDTLYAYQLYSYDLSGKVFVLSACNSGVGQIQQGEGVFSISRAFFYAGAEAVILTLWRIPDYQTSVLMDLFYEKLSKNGSAEKALRLAKLDYIKSSDALTSHPVYWAGLIVEGKTNPTGRGYTLEIAALALAVIGLSCVVFFKNRNQRTLIK